MTDKTKIYAWDGTNWVEVLVDATGRLIVVAEIDHLNDIGDVDVAAPTDLYILYWNDTNGAWECRALSDWTVPAHKDRHDPIDGADKLDTAAPVKVGSANAIGTSHSFPRADHVHEREHAKYLNAEAVTAMGVKGDANALHHDRYTNANAVTAVKADAGLPVVSITFIIDGGGVAITTGVKGYLEIPFACTINRVTMLADQSGSIVVDIWNDDYASFPPLDADSITASAPPTITTDTDSQDATLTGWTTAITAGDILAFNVDSCATITRVTISLKVTKT